MGRDELSGPALVPTAPLRRALEMAVGDTVVRGQQWGTGANWIVLVHDVGDDLDAWRDLPATLARIGYTVLLIDLPGHGLSDDPWDFAQMPTVLAEVIAEARQNGAARVFLVAPGQVADCCLGMVDLAVGGLVALSPGRGAQPCAPTLGDEAGGADRRRFPLLLLAGAADPDALAATQAVFAAWTEWAAMSVFPVTEQGTDLLQTSWADHVGEQIALFFRPHAVPF